METQEHPQMKIRKIWIVEKNNQGLNVKLENTLSSTIPTEGDAFQFLATDDSGEYIEYLVIHRILREVVDDGKPTSTFDAVLVVIRRPLQWQP